MSHPPDPKHCQHHRYYTLPSGRTGVHTCAKSPVTRIEEPTIMGFVLVSWMCDKHKEGGTDDD